MSDSSDKNIVIFVFIFTFVYINYIRIKINIKNDWDNMKCNPMNLWTSSFIKDPQTANAAFNTCINTLSAESIEKGLQSAYKKQTDVMQNIANQETILQSHLDQIDADINGHGGIIDQYNINEIKIDDIKEQQNTYKTINQLLATKDETTNNLYNFTTNVKEIFNNIKSFLPKLG